MSQPAWVTRRDAAAAAFVTEASVKTWQFRGWIDDKGKRRRLRTEDGLVLLGDVLDAERDTARKRGRCHRRLAPPAPPALAA